MKNTILLIALAALTFPATKNSHAPLNGDMQFGGCMSDSDCNDGYRCVGQIMGPPCDFSNPAPGCGEYSGGFCSP